jgi:serine/threonine-protein kinase
LSISLQNGHLFRRIEATDFGLTGTPLSSVIASQGQLPLAQALNIAAQICDGLAAAHHANVIHRDLKPSNIMIAGNNSKENAKILDFGTAKVLDNPGKNLTRTGDIFGTPQYMSPEQAQGQACDTRSDQYSLGCIVYEMVNIAAIHYTGPF